MTDDMPPIPETAIIPKPTPEAVARKVAAGLTELETLRHERDVAMEDNTRAMDLVGEAKRSIIRLQAEISDMKSRAVILQLERDEAVALHAKLQGLFISVMASMRAHEIPATPIIRERVAPDAEAPIVTTLPPLDLVAQPEDKT